MGKRKEPGTTRRGFAKAVLLAAATPLVAEAGQERTEPAADPAKALAEIVRARYGKHLSEEQLKDIEKSIGRGQRAAEFLKRTALQNGDEPSFVFRADLP